MKYLFLICGICLAAALILPFCGTPFLLVFIFALTVVLLGIHRRNTAVKIICIILLALICFKMFAASYYLLKFKNITTSEVTTECTVTSETAGGIYRVNVIKLDGKRTVSLGAELWATGNLLPGDKISGAFLIEKQEDKNRLKKLSDGVYFKLKDVNVVTSKEYYKVYSVAHKIRSFVLEAFKDSKNSDILYALTAGDKILIDEPLTSNIRRVGLSHVVVVSGMHFSVFCAVILFITRFLKLNNYITAILLLAFSIIFMAVCGFSKSVMRAGITYIIIAISIFTFKKPYPVVSMALSLLVTLFLNPFCVFSLSYQLSFLSTFGVLVISPKICKNIFERRRLSPFLKALISSVSVTVSAMLLTLPVTIYNFGGFSTVLIITNLLVSFAVTVILVLALIYLVLFSFGLKIIAAPFLFAADILTDYFKFVVNAFGNMRFSYITVNHEKVFAVLLVLIGIILWLHFKRSEKDAGIFNRQVRN